MDPHPGVTSSTARTRGIPSETPGTSQPSRAAEAHVAMRGSTGSHRQRVMVRVRIGITMFLLALLTMVTLGWMWTASHQPPRSRTASHTVLALAGIAGVFALIKIWRRDSPAISPGR